MRKRRDRIARLIIAVAVIGAAGAYLFVRGPDLFLTPLPPPPTITAPQGALPQGVVVFRERAPGGPCVGSGWYLRLPGGEVVAVTVAHSHAAWPDAGMEFTYADCGRALAVFPEMLRRGHRFEGFDLTTDYTILRVSAPPAAALVLEPDPRGAPQPGERVALYHGLGDAGGGQGVVEGTTESAQATAAWARMPPGSVYGGMSGGAVISTYTGKVVGMAIVISPRPGATVVGISPIAALVR